MNGEFKAAMAFAMKQECPGGDRTKCKSDAKDDPGGRTNQGVIQTTYDGYRQTHGQPLQSVYDAADSEIDMIYYERFWLRGGCDKLPHPLSILHFDGCVNVGTETRHKNGTEKRSAIQLLQQALGVTADGVIGAGTMAAIHAANIDELIMKVWAERVIYYDTLDEKNPALTKFLTGGWLRRLRHFYEEFVK
jgi:lysozyme family protein